MRSIVKIIEMFILERQERRLHKKYINELLSHAYIKYGNDTNTKLFYIEECLKKAEAKQIIKYEDNDGDDEYGRPIIRTFYGCPICNETIYRYNKYCKNCGQRLSFGR